MEEKNAFMKVGPMKNMHEFFIIETLQVMESKFTFKNMNLLNTENPNYYGHKCISYQI
jgi:hypothetical protein